LQHNLQVEKWKENRRCCRENLDVGTSYKLLRNSGGSVINSTEMRLCNKETYIPEPEATFFICLPATNRNIHIRFEMEIIRLLIKYSVVL
jgi:hypothetical protein